MAAEPGRHLIDDEFEDFAAGGWWLECFVKVEGGFVNDKNPDGWTRDAMTMRFWDAPAAGGLW